MPLILASSSRYRRELLERLRLTLLLHTADGMEQALAEVKG